MSGLIFEIASPYSWLLAIGAALAGSLHCAGMCGPLRLLAGPGSRWKYQAGRLSAYLSLGALGGLVGYALPLWVWLPAAALIAATALSGWIPDSGWKQKRARLMGLAGNHPYLLGAASGILPCGLLHGWIAVAAGTGHPLSGAVLLGILWAGSMPALEAPALLFRGPIQTLRKKAPFAGVFVFLVLAILPALVRMSSHHHGGNETPPPCHDSAHH